MADTMTTDSAVRQKARKFVEVLKTTETLPPAKMKVYQRRLQERLVRHAKEQVPFYEKRLDTLFGPKDTIRWEAWTDIEPFSRAEAQAAGDALFAKSTPSQAGDYSERATSGSTGMPLRVRTSGLVGLMGFAINQRIFNWHGINPDDSVCFILDDTGKFPYPDGESGANWNLINRNATAHNLSVIYTPQKQAEWVHRKQPDILSTYPRNGAAIVEELLRLGRKISFHTIIVHGEILEEDTRSVIEGAGIRIIDRFGGVDTGSISANCGQGPWHHQFSDVTLMETMPDDSQNANAGKRSTLLMTPFYNYAMPMIRYKNGDLVELSDEPCPCGRTLPRIDRILGRERNLFIFSDGSRIRPDMTRKDYEPFLSAKQFQVIQHTLTHIEMRYIADDLNQPIDILGLTILLQKLLHHDINVKLTRVDEIPRASSGKFETWKSHITADMN